MKTAHCFNGSAPQRRGMALVAPDGAVYRMLTPVPLGRMWTVKCVRMHV